MYHKLYFIPYTVNATTCTSLFIFLIKTKGLILKIYWSSHWSCSGKNVFLEIDVAIFKNILKITAVWICG